MVRVVKGEIRPKPKEQIVSDRLTKMRAKNSENYSARLANKLGLPYADLHIIPLSSEDIFTIPEDASNTLNFICYRKKGHELTCGSPDPENPELKNYITKLEERNGWNITLAVISPSSLARGATRYKHVYFVDALNSLRLTLSDQDLKEFEEGLGKLLLLKDQFDSLSTTQILTIILSGAVELGASDIHIEPQKKDIRLRYRVDGVLQDIVTLPYSVYKSIVSRIKLMSNMMINVRDRAQDGRFSFKVEDKQIDIRSSTIPSKNAEGLVLRVLDNSGINSSLGDIGITGKAYDDLIKTLGKTDGIILTTGPTGSGKTTTLYTIINHINSPQTKIITIENPIEYEFEGIVQTEVSESKDYTFSKALRAIVRQDPDVILVGEIRDDETADIAINAALTGHLVLSTLHTNGAAATIARLMELGVRPTLIPPAADIFLAQRLVRRLCACKKKHTPATEVAQNILKMVALISPKAKVNVPTSIETLWQPVGCKKCHNSGYKGRVGIFEALTITESIEKLILEMAGETQITKAAIEEGFITMTQDGILKALAGITSIEEVWRVTSESGIIEVLYDKLMSQSLTRRLHIDVKSQALAQENSKNIKVIGETLRAADSEQMLSATFAYSEHLNASDIHIEPRDEKAQIRLRIDGVLQTIATITLIQFHNILTNIKELANIPTTIRQGVSDSRFGVFFENSTDVEKENKKIDIRVSIIVGGFGETVVMRLLTSSDISKDIHDIGITPYNLDLFLSQARKPYGMILNTGPTGSGKTTTLYNVLNEIKNDAIKIITIEDPIEYQLSGILQTQINPAEDYTFPKALRALLRQDPDVILVGEIRDNETAQTAVNAAQTGHLLISSLHTNNAASALQRLGNLGISSDDLTSSVNAIMAQRLVRKLCDCKKPVSPSAQEKKIIEKALSSIAQKVSVEIPTTFTIYNPGDCALCNGMGFKGRTVISEVLTMNNDIATAVSAGALVMEITKKATQNGMLTMEQDAILKALAGDTTLDEVRRTTML